MPVQGLTTENQLKNKGKYFLICPRKIPLEGEKKAVEWKNGTKTRNATRMNIGEIKGKKQRRCYSNSQMGEGG